MPKSDDKVITVRTKSPSKRGVPPANADQLREPGNGRFTSAGGRAIRPHAPAKGKNPVTSSRLAIVQLAQQVGDALAKERAEAIIGKEYTVTIAGREVKGNLEEVCVEAAITSGDPAILFSITKYFRDRASGTPTQKTENKHDLSINVNVIPVESVN